MKIDIQQEIEDLGFECFPYKNKYDNNYPYNNCLAIDAPGNSGMEVIGYIVKKLHNDVFYDNLNAKSEDEKMNALDLHYDFENKIDKLMNFQSYIDLIGELKQTYFWPDIVYIKKDKND